MGNTQDRYKVTDYWTRAKIFFLACYQPRMFIINISFPMIIGGIMVCIHLRREPMELMMDREEYFRNFDSMYYGVYFDHHAWSHMLCARRANKWGYHDATLDHAHH